MSDLIVAAEHKQRRGALHDDLTDGIAGNSAAARYLGDIVSC